MIHGGLLVFKVLLLTRSPLLDDCFGNILQITFFFRENKDKLIRQTIIQILPYFSATNPSLVVERHLSDTFTFLLSCLNHSSDRNLAFTSIADFIFSIRSHVDLAIVNPFIERLVAALLSALQSQNKKETCAGALICISKLAETFQSSVTLHVRSLVPFVLHHGLQDQVKTTFISISSNIPSLLPEIQERILNYIS